MPRAKADSGKPRGRMTAYAFFVQTCREEHKRKHPDENVVFSEFSKKCAERWKTMSNGEKQRFQEMADRDKTRFTDEMKDFEAAGGDVGGKGRKRKNVKDPNAPKRSLSAFFWFCNEERPHVKEENPDFSVGDVAKALGKKWAVIEPSVKAKYEAMAEKDKARYEREMSAYKKGAKPAAAESDEEEDEDEDSDE